MLRAALIINRSKVNDSRDCNVTMELEFMKVLVFPEI